MVRSYVRTPTVYQMESTECGAASLAMILAFHGKRVSLEELRIETGVSRDGCNARDILLAAETYGLEASGYRMASRDLYSLRPPCILYWNGNHFVVYEGKKGNRVYVNDPAHGRRRMPVNEFEEGYSGIVLTFQKTDSFVPSGTGSDPWKGFADALALNREALLQNRREWIGILAMETATALLSVVGIFLFRYYIDVVLPGIGGRQGMLPVAFASVLTAISWLCLRYNGRMRVKRLQDGICFSLAHRFLTRLFRLSIPFFEQRYASEISGRMGDIERLGRQVSVGLAGFADAFVQLVACLCCLASLNPVWLVAGLFFQTASFVPAIAASESVRERYVKSRIQDGELFGALLSGLAAIASVQSSGTEGAHVRKLCGQYDGSLLRKRDYEMEERLVRIAENMILATGMAILLCLGAFSVMERGMTRGTWAVCALFSVLSAVRFHHIRGFTGTMMLLQTEADRLRDIMDFPQASTFINPPSMPMDGKLKGSVTVRDLKFGYRLKAEPLVKDVCFSLACGQSVAIVGRPGSGKSTVAKLVCGLYDPWEGQILFDGMAAGDLPREVVNTSIACVSQTVTLFSGTVRENLTMWNDNILEEDMVHAAKDACIHDVIIERPGAYDYVLSEDGGNFSEGQRQRLEIARALAVNPSVLVMDEATSALDPLTERCIMDNIKRRGITCIVIAHRPAAIRDCGEILVMDGGRIVERGSREELSAMDGVYRALFA